MVFGGGFGARGQPFRGRGGFIYPVRGMQPFRPPVGRGGIPVQPIKYARPYGVPFGGGSMDSVKMPASTMPFPTPLMASPRPPMANGSPFPAYNNRGHGRGGRAGYEVYPRSFRGRRRGGFDGVFGGGKLDDDHKKDPHKNAETPIKQVRRKGKYRVYSFCLTAYD